MWQWFKWVLLTILLLGLVWAVMTFIVHPKKSNSTLNKFFNSLGQYPACPKDLSGILTHQLMDPQYIGAMIPLGNVAPPGHTSPVDHIYFELNTDTKVPLYAPADGWITHIMASSVKNTPNGNYEFDSYVITYTICNGLVLDFAGYTDINQSLKDELAKHQDACKGGIQKVGHSDYGEQQCDYQSLNIKVTSGEQIGWTQRPSNGNILFEIWAANYNQPSKSGVDWTYYNDDRYAHAMCTFDLYTGDLKNQFFAKFGSYDGNFPNSMTFTPRTAQPLCGTVNQDIVGTIQGMWFSHKPDLNDKSGDVGTTGGGISIIHNNIDPTQGEVVIGGEMHDNLTGVMTFPPAHSGTINREPSEVKADGQTYCYQDNNLKNLPTQQASGKVLIQLVDDHHLKAENQTGTCGIDETFKSPFNFER